MEIDNVENKIEEKENKNKLAMNKKGFEIDNLKDRFNDIEKELREIEEENINKINKYENEMNRIKDENFNLENEMNMIKENLNEYEIKELNFKRN